MPEIGESAIPSNIRFGKDEGGGGLFSKIKSIFSSEPQTPSNTPQEVRPTNERPDYESFSVELPNSYMLGRPDDREDAASPIQRRINILPGDGQYTALSRKQLEIKLLPGRRDEPGNFTLFVENLGLNDILKAERDNRSLNLPERLPGSVSRKKNIGEPHMIPSSDRQLKNYRNAALLMLLNDNKALRIEITSTSGGVGQEEQINGEVSFKAWTVDKSGYDELLERALKEEEEF